MVDGGQPFRAKTVKLGYANLMGRNKIKPTDQHFMMARVVKAVRISPNFMRLTLAGLEGLHVCGFDQWCRLFFTRTGQEVLALPTRTSEFGWHLQYLATPKAQRPWVRAYTIREARPEVGEVDIDFVLHGDHDQMGPAAKFALAAQPGDELGFLDRGNTYDVERTNAWTLLVGDETALPAIAGICRSLPDSTQGIAIIEIPSSEDQQQFTAPTGMEIRWVARDESSETQEKPGQLALKELMDTTLPETEIHAHTIGESALATGARRYLIQEHGLSKRNIDFMGYWRHGRAQSS